MGPYQHSVLGSRDLSGEHYGEQFELPKVGKRLTLNLSKKRQDDNEEVKREHNMRGVEQYKEQRYQEQLQ